MGSTAVLVFVDLGFFSLLIGISVPQVQYAWCVLILGSPNPIAAPTLVVYVVAFQCESAKVRRIALPVHLPPLGPRESESSVTGPDV